jgi:hypothetical protein
MGDKLAFRLADFEVVLEKFSDFVEQSLGRFTSRNGLWATHCLQQGVVDGWRHQDRIAISNAALDACGAIAINNEREISELTSNKVNEATGRKRRELNLLVRGLRHR